MALLDKATASFVNDELRGITGAIHDHKFFEGLRNAGFSPSTLRAFAHQYSLASAAFPGILAAACASLPGDALRFPLVMNLWDEHGQGDLSKSHRKMFGDFVSAADRALATAGEAPQPVVETLVYLRGMRALVDDPDPAEVLGAVWFCEVVTPAQYSVVHRALERFPGFEKTGLVFWKEHMDHDGEHVAQLNAAVVHALKSDNDALLFERGAEQALVLERVFWDGIVGAATKLDR